MDLDWAATFLQLVRRGVKLGRLCIEKSLQKPHGLKLHTCSDKKHHGIKDSTTQESPNKPAAGKFIMFELC